MADAAAGLTSRSFLWRQDKNVAHEVMKMTGKRIARRMAELGRDMVLCNQSLDEYRSVLGTPPSSSASRNSTFPVPPVAPFRPVDIQESHPSDGSSESSSYVAVRSRTLTCSKRQGKCGIVVRCSIGGYWRIVCDVGKAVTTTKGGLDKDITHTNAREMEVDRRRLRWHIIVVVVVVVVVCGSCNSSFCSVKTDP